jgi:hypothetical protein
LLWKSPDNLDEFRSAPPQANLGESCEVTDSHGCRKQVLDYACLLPRWAHTSDYQTVLLTAYVN